MPTLLDPECCLLADGTASTLFMLGLLLVVGVVLRGARRKSSSRGQPIASWGQARPDSNDAALRDPPAEIARWEVRMHDLARDLSGQLDSKIVILEQLIRDAQQATARLEESLRRTPGRTSAPTAWSAPPLSENDLWIDPPETIEAVFRTAPTGQRRQAQIYQLADEGHSSQSIAEQTGAPVGEVELVLSLRSRAG